MLKFYQPFLDKLLNPANLLKSKYSRQTVEQVLTNYLGETRLSDCLTNVLITSYEIEHTQTTENYFCFVDGGVVANNPVMCAYTEIRNKYPDEEEILMVSLGTGEIGEPIPFSKAEQWGVAGWAKPLFDIFLDGSNDTVDHQARLVVGQDAKKNYYRIQPDLPIQCAPLDRSDDINIRRLKEVAESSIKNNSGLIDEIIEAII